MALAIRDYTITLTSVDTAMVSYHIKDTGNDKLSYGGDLTHTVTPTNTR